MADPVSASILVGGSLASAGLGFFGSSAASKRQYKNAINLMNHQYNLTRQLNQNAYQDTTYSMRQAGINPMLAITNGINGLSAGSGGMPSANNDVEAGLNSAMAFNSIKNERKRVENETAVKDSTVSVNKSQEDLNTYLGDKAHYESSTARELSQREAMLNEFINKDPERYFGAQLQVLDSQAIKNLTEAQNSAKYTNALIKNLSFQDENYKATTAKSLQDTKVAEVEEQIKNKQLDWFDMEKYAKSLGIGVGAFISIMGLKKLPSGKFIKPAENLIQVVPKKIQLP